MKLSVKRRLYALSQETNTLVTTDTEEDVCLKDNFSYLTVLIFLMSLMNLVLNEDEEITPRGASQSEELQA